MIQKNELPCLFTTDPGWLSHGTLPHIGAELRAIGSEIVTLAAGLLTACDAPLLCLALTPAERAGALAIVPWDRAMVPNPDFSRSLCAPTSPHRSATIRIDKAAARLFDLLQERWPAYARPLQLGVITDGSGLGFSADDLWPLRRGWLSRQILGQTTFTVILPFDRWGAWSTLNLRAANDRPY